MMSRTIGVGRIKSNLTGHPDTAQGLNNLALPHESRGEYAKAEPLYRRSLEVNEKTLGPEHPSTIIIRKNYALCLEALNSPKN